MNFEQYYKICDAGILINNVTKFKNNKKPKISIISSIYNKQNYILRFLLLYYLFIWARKTKNIYN